ncbi:MAG: S-adenosylmethionine decarboxylase [Beggiatoa sp. IS2]|nr:MAG: S-adenosylmethionine decarboxylase [Beggiatoa sp. IS2]
MSRSLKKLKFKLQGFNNLTKTLSFNIYDICYTQTIQQRKQYISYIDEVYNANRLTQILTNVASIIGANILNIAHQDYEPQGASVTMLISEESTTSQNLSSDTEEPGPLPDVIVAHLKNHTAVHIPGTEWTQLIPLPDAIVTHLDKSHITVHTYPESHPDNGISTFRADIDVSTCGRISPLKALNYLIHCFDSDIVIMDYRVRGFTRDTGGRKHYIDHKINSIQNYIDKDTCNLYQMIDVNVYQENIFHTKMVLKQFDLDNYLFDTQASDLWPQEREKIEQRLRREMMEIFYSENIPEV